MLLNYTDIGTGQPVVLLHGMAGSTHYWDQLMPLLQNKYRVISLDLLGFGRSPMPKNITYNYHTHIESIIQTLDHIGISHPFILIGHSMGGLIALRLSAQYPSRVKKLVLIAMPIYTTSEQAHKAITKSSRLKEWAYYGRSSKILCNLWCRYLRPISSRLAPKYLPYLTTAAASDSILHTWQSYAQSLQFIIESQNVTADLSKVPAPITLIYGDKDMPLDLSMLKLNLNHKNSSLVLLPGTHQVLNEQTDKIAQLL